MNRFKNVDFVRAHKILTLRAMKTVRSYNGPDVFAGGFDFEDVVGEVFEEFFESSDGLGWKESKGSIDAFLGRILHNKIVDHLRRQKRLATSLLDENVITIDSANAASTSERGDFTEKLYALVGTDSSLRDLIAAAEMTSGSHNVNQELGALLEKTPHQISKLKERLLKKEGVKELYAARQATKSGA